MKFPTGISCPDLCDVIFTLTLSRVKLFAIKELGIEVRDEILSFTITPPSFTTPVSFEIALAVLLVSMVND